MWERKSVSAAFVRTIKQAPSSIRQAGLKSLSSLEKAGKIANYSSDALGHLGSITAAAVGRVIRKESDPTATPTRYSPQRKRRHTRIPRLAIMLGALFVLALTAGLIDWTREAYRTFSISGLLLSPIFMIALLSATFWFWRELRLWRSLAIVEQLQSDLSCPCETAAEQDRFRTAFAQLCATVREPQFARFVGSPDVAGLLTVRNTGLRIGRFGMRQRSVVIGFLDLPACREVREDLVGLRDGLDRIGLQGMDKNAIDAIRNGTRDVFFLSLLNSNALAEVVIYTIRALGLIRRVASAYGYRPGRLGVIRLARHILADIALLPVGMVVALEGTREVGSAIDNVAGRVGVAVGHVHPVAGVAIDAAGRVVGAAVGGITPKVAEATLAAGRMAHFGLLAAAHVRPVAFSQSSYAEVRNSLFRQVVRLRKSAIQSRKDVSDALPSEGTGAP